MLVTGPGPVRPATSASRPTATGTAPATSAGWTHDGYLYITGRASSVVKVGGNRVSTEEVAAQLRRHTRRAGRRSSPSTIRPGRAGSSPSSWAAGVDVEDDVLRAWMGERHPAYKVPRTVRRLADLPVDSSGKVSLQTLHAMAATPEEAS